ncbi:MAG: CPBP family intramembrane glutamic endopeptidase [Candidatus Bathyarchaeia archaeon]
MRYSYIVSALVVVGTYLFSLPLGLFLLYTVKEGVEYLSAVIKPFIIAYMVPLPLPLCVTVGYLFPILTFIYSVCFLFTYRAGPPIRSSVGRKGSAKSLFSNWLLAMPFVSSLVLGAVIALQSLQETAGVPTGSIQFSNPFNALISLSYAPLVEEVGFRITPLGTVVLIRILRSLPVGGGILETGRAVLDSLLNPDKVKREAKLPTIEANGMGGVSIWEWLTLLITSITFGLAHYLFGGGWDIGKVSSAFLAGLALGLVYLWKGAAASILLHWFFNYYGYVYNIASDYFPKLFAVFVNIIDAALTLSLLLGAMNLLTLAASRLHSCTKAKRETP